MHTEMLFTRLWFRAAVTTHLAWILQEVQREARLAWVAFSAAAAAGAQTPLAAEPAAEAAAEVAEGGQYLHRLPALAQRLGGVLQGALYAEPAADTPLIEGGFCAQCAFVS